MNPAAFYDQKLSVQKRVIVKNSPNGQDEEHFLDNGKVWANVEYQNSRRQTDYGATQTGSTLVIRVRNYPALSALDRLYSAQWQERYIIEGIRRGDNELIVDAHLFDELELQ